MDVLKKRIAYQVREQVRLLDRSSLPNGVSLEVSSVDQLNTQIRVRQLEAAPRYFLVKVSEQL